MSSKQGQRSPGTDCPNNPTLKAALDYLRAGISILPIALDGSKGPALADLPRIPNGNGDGYLPTWKPYQSQRMTEDDARRIWGRTKPPGIATIGGAVSGLLEHLDFDRDATTVFPAWCELVESMMPGLIERLSVVRTPRQPQGYHVRFRVSALSVPGNTVLAKLSKSAEPEGDKRVLIETRGEGGYALTPGSPPCCHEASKEYIHESGPPPWNPPTITAEERAILIEAAQTFDRATEDSPVVYKGKGELRPGDDYNLRGPDWSELLLPDGWTLARQQGEKRLWCRPGKNKGYSATTGVCKGKDGVDLLYVFSSNVAPLESQHCYSKFAYLTLTKHHGDFAACATELRHGGFGAKQSLPSRPQGGGVSGVLGYRGIGVSPWSGIATVEPYAPFPVTALPPGVRELVQEAEAAMRIDPAYVALPALAVLAAAIGNSRSVWLKHSWPSEPCVLWTLVIGESGSGKSPPYDLAVAPVHQIDEEWGELFEAEMADHQEALAAWEAAPKAERGENPIPPRQRHLVVEDITIESLAEILAASPRGVLATRDELSAWFRSFTRYRSKGNDSDEAPWLSMYSARRLKVNRKTGENRCLRVPGAAVSVTGTIQPGILARLLGRDQFESGLAPRLLLGMPQKPLKQWTEKDITPITLSGYCDLVRKLVDLPMREEEGRLGSHRLQLTQAARESWIRWYNEWGIEQFHAEGDLAATYSKLEAVAVRLALIGHVATEVHQGRDAMRNVSRPAMDSGIVLARWFAQEARRVYVVLRESDEAKAIRKLIDYIQRQGGSITASQLHKSNRSAYPSTEAAQAELDLLVSVGAARWEQTSGQPGRPTDRCVLFESEEDSKEHPTPIPQYPETPETLSRAGGGQGDKS